MEIDNKCPKCGEYFTTINTTHAILIPKDIIISNINPMGSKDAFNIYPLSQLMVCVFCGGFQREFKYENQEYYEIQPYNLKYMHGIK